VQPHGAERHDAAKDLGRREPHARRAKGAVGGNDRVDGRRRGRGGRAAAATTAAATATTAAATAVAAAVAAVAALCARPRAVGQLAAGAKGADHQPRGALAGRAARRRGRPPREHRGGHEDVRLCRRAVAGGRGGVEARLGGGRRLLLLLLPLVLLAIRGRQVAIRTIAVVAGARVPAVALVVTPGGVVAPPPKLEQRRLVFAEVGEKRRVVLFQLAQLRRVRARLVLVRGARVAAVGCGPAAAAVRVVAVGGARVVAAVVAV